MVVWEECVEKAVQIIEAREKYQRTLGSLAFDISQQFGMDGLLQFADDLKEQGVTVSVSTLRNYRWVYERTHSLELPEDLSYRTLQVIAASGRPEYWSDRIRAEGLSNSDVYHLIREEKGIKRVKIITCPLCQKDFDLSEVKEGGSKS